MLPADVLLLKKEESELYKLQSVVDSTVHSFIPKRGELAQRKPGLSFMIDDILGDSRNRRVTTHVSHEAPRSPCSQCSSFPTDKNKVVCTMPNLASESQSYALSQGPSHSLPSSSSALVPPLSPASVSARFGYYSPAIASSPPFSFAGRSSDVFTFIPNDFNEHMQANFFNVRQDGFVRSPLYSPSVILDLSNYVPRSSSMGILPSPVVAVPSPNVDCSGSRQIIWKHINRNPAKRKGGQIRFTNEQTTTLENTFSEHKYLTSTERKRLATTLRLSERQVKTWFQNRRAKWRRAKLDPTGRASSPDSEECSPTDEMTSISKCKFSSSNDNRISAFK